MTAITLHLQLREYDYPEEEYNVRAVSKDIITAVCLRNHARHSLSRSLITWMPWPINFAMSNYGYVSSV